MRNILKNLREYFTRLFNALFNLDYYVSLTKEEEFYSFLEQNKDRIKYLMEFNDKNPNGKLKVIESYNDINGIETIKIRTDLISEKTKKVSPFYRFRPRKISKSLKAFLNKNQELNLKSVSTGTNLGDNITLGNFNKNNKL